MILKQRFICLSDELLRKGASCLFGNDISDCIKRFDIKSELCATYTSNALKILRNANSLNEQKIGVTLLKKALDIENNYKIWLLMLFWMETTNCPREKIKQYVERFRDCVKDQKGDIVCYSNKMYTKYCVDAMVNI